MKLYHRNEKSICVISIEGDMIDDKVSIVVEYIKPILADESVTGFVINLDKVISIDSAGIGELLIVDRRLKQRHAKMALCHLDKHLLETLKIARTDSLFNIFKTEEEAIAAL